MANTGGGAGGALHLHGAALFGADRLARLDAASSRPSATVSPALPVPRFTGSSPRSENTPAARSSRPSAPVTTVPSPNSPVSTRTKRKLAAVRGVQRLHHVGGRLGVLELQPPRRHVDRRRLVAQRLQQPEDAVVVARRAEQHRTDEAVAELLRQILEDLVARGRHVGKQLLHQLVVMVGELLQHVEAGFLLALRNGLGKLDDLGRRVGAIDEGAFGGEVDEAGGDAVLPDGDLPQHQRLGARRLQHRDQLAQRDFGFVDLIEKQEMGDAAVFELLEDDLQRRDALGVGLADDDGRIAGRKGQRALVLEFDRAGAVDEGEVVAEKGDVGDVELHAHAVVARFWAGVAYARFVRQRSPARWMAPVRANMASRSVVLPLR